MRITRSIVPTLLVLASAVTAAGGEMWRPKAEETSFVPDWSKADEVDAAATRLFLRTIWPRVRKASDALSARAPGLKTGVYSGPMSAAEKAAGVVAFSVAVETVLPWYAVPSEPQVASREISLFAARGQSEAACVAVHALKDAGDVHVKCSDLRGPGTIPANAVTTRLSLAYTVDPRGRGRNVHARQMLLLNVPSWDIARGRTAEWVVDVHVPKTAKPGDYAGKIDVTANGRKAAEFELKLKVLPFELTDNGVRWGAFMTPNPGHATEAWCDLNSRYGYNTLAWWNLDNPCLRWTWDGCRREELVFAKLRYSDGKIISSGDAARLPAWVKRRIDGPFVVFKLGEVIGLPREHAERSEHYKKPLDFKAELGAIPPEQKRWICYDRPGYSANFSAGVADSVRFEEDDAFRRFDAGMKRLKRHGFTGPVTWFGSGNATTPWETRVMSMRFGVKYSRSGWRWSGKVDPGNSNHVWYLANAAMIRTFAEARKKHGWPEVVWCPNDESFQNRGVTGRAAACMLGEMMPYIREFAPGSRIYTVVWHKEKNWKGMWQCGTLMKFREKNGKPSPSYGPFHVICTNCPNDDDRRVTRDAGGEYWIYTLIYSVTPKFSGARYSMGFRGARHFSAVNYNYADKGGLSNLAPGADAAKSDWIAGEAKTGYYLAADPDKSPRIDHAIASHAMLAIRQGVTDRRYVETLRAMAHAKKSAGDIEFLASLGPRLDSVGSGRGGVDDFTATAAEGAAGRLRREIAERITRLARR